MVQSRQPFNPDVDPYDDEMIVSTNIRPGNYIFLAVGVERKWYDGRNGRPGYYSRSWSMLPVGGDEKRPATLPDDWRWQYSSTDVISPTNSTGRLIAALLGVESIEDMASIKRGDYLNRYVVASIVLTDRGYNQLAPDTTFAPLTEDIWNSWKWSKGSKELPEAQFAESEDGF